MNFSKFIGALLALMCLCIYLVWHLKGQARILAFMCVRWCFVSLDGCIYEHSRYKYYAEEYGVEIESAERSNEISGLVAKDKNNRMKDIITGFMEDLAKLKRGDEE